MSRLKFHSVHIGLPLNYPAIQQLREVLIAAVVCTTVLTDTLGRKSWFNEISWNRNHLLWAILSFSFLWRIILTVWLNRSTWCGTSFSLKIWKSHKYGDVLDLKLWFPVILKIYSAIQLNRKKTSTSCGIMAMVCKELKLFFKGKKLFRLIWVYLSKWRPLAEKY